MATSNVIAIHKDDETLLKHAAGRIVFWTNSGDVTVDAFSKALIEAGSFAVAPDAPSALVALHRAVENVAKTLGHLDVHHKGRGEWAIVSNPREVDDLQTGKALVYAVRVSAKVVYTGDDKNRVASIEVSEGEGAQLIRDAFDAAKGLLAPSDIGSWLCEKLTKLDAVPLRGSGGVYFLPHPSVVKCEKITSAIKASTRHTVSAIPAMRTADAIDAILQAVTADTQATCDKIAADVADGSLGAKALASREKVAAELLERSERYEGILGKRLDALRDAIGLTRAAVATALLAAASAEGE
jgi:hypothetical protein